MIPPIDISGYLQLAANKSSFVREQYTESDLPTSLNQITVLPFFGDYKQQFILSSLLFHRYLGEVNPNRYIILASYVGLSGIFPYVDEYWGIADNSLANELLERGEGSDKSVFLRRGLREYFKDIITWDENLKVYYDDGITKNFFDTFGRVQLFLPSLKSLKMDLNRVLANYSGYKVFIHPTKTAKSWVNGQVRTNKIDKEFWLDLLAKFLKSGITPVVWQNGICHDLSGEFAGRMPFFSDSNVLDVLAAMRACSCVLDIHSGIQRYATIARCPCVCVDERQKFVGVKEFELNDLCVLNKKYFYIFSFITILESGRWMPLIDNILGKLADFLPTVKRDEFPTTSEYNAVVPYSVVKKRKSKRLGTSFVKVPKII